MSAQAAQTPASQKTPKVLRIGLIREGQQGIAQEKLFRIGEAVTVGESPKCAFTIPGTKLGQRHELFIARPDGNDDANAWIVRRYSRLERIVSSCKLSRAGRRPGSRRVNRPRRAGA